ncbi:MAG: zinc ribbon domain-containing protein [Ruminococcus sp.]|nr:zinc ribbon domain-containing protein [Ruminococcus sp.]
MFCRKCGAQISGAEKFCPQCGAQVIPAQQPNNGSGFQAGPASQPVKAAAGKNKVPYLAIGALVIIAVIVIVLVKTLFFSNNYEKPIKNFMKAVEEQDTDLLLSVFPDEIYEYMEEETGMDEEEVEEYMEYSVESMADYYLGDIKIKYEIDDVRDLSKGEIQDIEDEFYDIMDIKDGKSVEIETKVYVDGEKVEDEDITLEVIKVGGKWYLNPMDIF